MTRGDANLSEFIPQEVEFMASVKGCGLPTAGNRLLRTPNLTRKGDANSDALGIRFYE